MRRRFKDLDPTSSLASSGEFLRVFRRAVYGIPVWEGAVVSLYFDVEVKRADLKMLNSLYSEEEQDELLRKAFVSFRESPQSAALAKHLGQDWSLQLPYWCKRHQRDGNEVEEEGELWRVISRYTRCSSCPCLFVPRGVDLRHRYCSGPCRQAGGQVRWRGV